MRKSIEFQKLSRILDANFNRAKEGLRVCEDICRYGFDLKKETRQLKDMRHVLTGVIEPLGIKSLLKARDIGGDIGRVSTVSEFKRRDLNDVFYANAQRVKESMRVLEEILKLIDGKKAQVLKEWRYKFYAVEQKMLERR